MRVVPCPATVSSPTGFHAVAGRCTTCGVFSGKRLMTRETNSRHARLSSLVGTGVRYVVIESNIIQLIHPSFLVKLLPHALSCRLLLLPLLRILFFLVSVM